MTIQEVARHLTPASVSNLKLGNCFCTFGTKTIVFCFEGKAYVAPYSELLESFLFQHLQYSVDLQNIVKGIETTLRQSDDRELMKILTSEKCKEISRKMGIQPISLEVLKNSIKVGTTDGIVTKNQDGAVCTWYAIRDKFYLNNIKMCELYLGHYNVSYNDTSNNEANFNVATFITPDGTQYFTKFNGKIFIDYLESLGYKRNNSIGVPCSNGYYPAFRQDLKDAWDKVEVSDFHCSNLMNL